MCRLRNSVTTRFISLAIFGNTKGLGKRVKMITKEFGDFNYPYFCYPLWLQVIESWLYMKGMKTIWQFRWQMRSIILTFNLPSCVDPQCVTNMLSSLFWKWFQHVVVSWDFGCSGLSGVSKRCSSGQRSLTGLRFVGCPASSGMEMHEWSCNGYCCDVEWTWDLESQDLDLEKSPLCHLTSCVTLGKSTNF